MSIENYKEIAKDTQIRKFCAYGFLKNLKFFEPFLIIFIGISVFFINLFVKVPETAQ